MTTTKIEYIGELRTHNTHVRSGNTIITDAPTDNCGKGEAFSPTDLMSTSLVNCILTITGIKAKDEGFSLACIIHRKIKRICINILTF